MTPPTMTPTTTTLTTIGAIVGMLAILWYTIYTLSPLSGTSPPNTRWSLAKTKTESLMSSEQKATFHICEAYALAKRHRPGLTEPPNFYVWLQVPAVVDKKEVLRVLQERITPLMHLQMRMMRDPDDDEAHTMGRTGDRMIDSVLQRQLEIEVNSAIAYVLSREEERSIYDQVFLPLLDDQLIDKAWYRSKWDRVEEKCRDI